MSALRLIARRAPAARQFSTIPALRAGKESNLHNDNRGHETERIKNEQVQKQKQGKGEWHDQLASDSESAVKADRDEAGSTKEHIEKLQKEGSKK